MPQRSKILVIQWARLGDLFHSRVLCESALRVWHPADVTISCDQRYAGIVQSFPEVASVLGVDLTRHTALVRLDSSLPDVLSGMYELIESHSGFDTIINLTNHITAERFVRALGARSVFGYGGTGGDRLKRSESDNPETHGLHHIAHEWQSLIEPNKVMRFPQNLSAHVTKSAKKSFALICDAGDPRRDLNSETISVLAKTASELAFEEIVLLGAKKSHNVKLTGVHIVDRRGETTLAELRAHLEQTHLVVGPDTGSLHFAAALGKSTLGLYFGGALPERTGPLSTRAVNISHKTQDEIFVRLAQQSLLEVCHQTISNDVSEQTDCSPCTLSIVITEYGQTHYADELLLSIKSHNLPPETEVLVISSGLDAVDERIASERTGVTSDIVDGKRSFAEACNRGVLLANGDWVLFLNDDCELSDEALNKLLDSREPGAIVAPRLRNWDGLIQSAGFTYDGHEVKDIAEGQWRKSKNDELLAGVSAAVMLIERETFTRLGGFDPSFQNGYEDVDLCIKASAEGLKFKMVDCDVTHYRGASPSRFDAEDRNLRLLQSRWNSGICSKPTNKSRPQNDNPRILFISDEESYSAAATLRWRSPLTRCGLQENRDFKWLCVRDIGSLNTNILKHLDTIVVFRSISNIETRNALFEWRLRTSGTICYDCDDILLNRFPIDSIRHRKRAAFEASVHELIIGADICIAPNERIARQYDQSAAEKLIVSTLPFSRHFANVDKKSSGDVFRIGYCGSEVHQTDLALVTPTLCNLLEEHESIWFYWWGAHPGNLSSHTRVRRGGSWVFDYETHVERVQNVDIDLWIAPLNDAEHNSVRSPIKAFEYIGGSMPCLFSDVEPFRNVLGGHAADLLVNNESGAWHNAIEAWRDISKQQTLLSEVGAMKSEFQKNSLDLSKYHNVITKLGRHHRAPKIVTLSAEAFA